MQDDNGVLKLSLLFQYRRRPGARTKGKCCFSSKVSAENSSGTPEEIPVVRGPQGGLALILVTHFRCPISVGTFQGWCGMKGAIRQYTRQEICDGFVQR